jgi:prophage maintenance system killer protein
MASFLYANGYELTIDNDRAYTLVQQVAQSQLIKTELTLYLEENVTGLT